MGRRWIYHATEEPKIIENEKFEAYEERKAAREAS